MRRKRAIYFNDARHYYLWLYDPPIDIQDAWRPIDEIASTGVDTVVYGVERGDGCFYPSQVGMVFGAATRPFKAAYEWRAWECMQSLIARGLDPLLVLVDRAHEKGLDFFASLRLRSFGGMAPALNVSEGGRGFAHREVRDHHFAMLEELATRYPLEGIELDFIPPSSGSAFYLRPEDLDEYTPVTTEWVKDVSHMVKGRSSRAQEIGARVYPTEETNLAAGLDVKAWLRDGLVDYVAPMVYGHNVIDCDMPIDWLLGAAHRSDASVYPMIMPYYNNEREGHVREYATPEMMRAAFANYWAQDADGMYTWFLQWPLGDRERRILTELGDPDLVCEADKHYVVNRRSTYTEAVGFERPLPIKMALPDAGKRHTIPFYIADDIGRASDRIRQVLLRLKFTNMVTGDRLSITLNGLSLADETCLRSRGGSLDLYSTWLEFQLEDVRPRKGKNTLEISLEGRPPGLEGEVTLEDVEMRVEYTPYPSGLDSSQSS